MRCGMNFKILNSVVFRNFLSLGLLQIINYISPIIIMPYLIRVLGVQSIGDINFSQTIISYVTVFVVFGYNFTGTKSISENSNDKSKIAQVLVESILFRTFLCVVGLFFLLTLSLLVEKIYSVIWIILSFYGLVISQVLFPTWFYHGLQKMRYVLYLGAFSKLIVLIFTFLLVNEESDYILVPLINSISGIVIGVLSIIIIIYKLDVPICYRNIKLFGIIRKNYYLGRDVFLQQAYVSMYGPINIIFLGLLSSSEVVGYFTIVEKLIYVPIMFFSMAAQAFYPYAVKVFKRNKEEYFTKLMCFSLGIFVSSALVSFIFMYFREDLMPLVIGHKSDLGQELLYIMIFGLPFAAMGNVITQVFVTIDKQKILNRVSLIIMIVTVSISWLIIKNYGAEGLSMFIVVRQALVMVSCLTIIMYFFKRGKV